MSLEMNLGHLSFSSILSFSFSMNSRVRSSTLESGTPSFLALLATMMWSSSQTRAQPFHRCIQYGNGVYFGFKNPQDPHCQKSADQQESGDQNECPQLDFIGFFHDFYHKFSIQANAAVRSASAKTIKKMEVTTAPVAALPTPWASLPDAIPL